MNRRNFSVMVGALALVAGAALPFALPAQKPARPVAQAARLDHRELPADQQIIHALSRLTFGARPGDVQKVRERSDSTTGSTSSFIPRKSTTRRSRNFSITTASFTKTRISLLQDYAAAQRDRRLVKRQAGDTTQGVSRQDSMAFQQIGMKRRQVGGQLQSARVARAVISNRQLDEVMTDFWLNHFNVFAQKGPPEVYYLAEYERDVIRPHALGKFRDLLEAVAKSPAMLFYLDNARSMADSTRPRLASYNQNQRPGRGAFARRGGQRGQMADGSTDPQQARGPPEWRKGLNENYARELMELHTLGVDGGYTQQDIIEVARALTGWTMNPRVNAEFVFRPEIHDAGQKVVLGHVLPAGRGIEDGEEVLDIVARHPATAHFIARKLAIRFVSDDPPAALVDRAAQTFLKTDGDIREVVRTIVTSPEFFSRSGVSQQGEEPVRARGVGAARGWRTGRHHDALGADRRLPRRADLRPSGAERVARDGRGVDEQRRDSQSHQLRPRSRGRTVPRRVGLAVE